MSVVIVIMGINVDCWEDWMIGGEVWFMERLLLMLMVMMLYCVYEIFFVWFLCFDFMCFLFVWYCIWVGFLERVGVESWYYFGMVMMWVYFLVGWGCIYCVCKMGSVGGGFCIVVDVMIVECYVLLGV